MADDDTPTDKGAVQLTPGKPAQPKLAPVTPGPKTVTVSVPKATPVPTAAPTQPNAPAAPVVDAQATDDLIKKGDLLDQIVETTGVKRADAKSVMEAFLGLMAENLIADNQLQLPPLGKIKVVKSKPVGQGATALTLRVRTPNSD